MKKARVLFAFILAFSMAGFLYACHAGHQNTASAKVSASAAQVTTVSAAAPAIPSPSVSPVSASPSASAAAPFQFEEKSYTSGVISIKYPQIFNYSDQALQDKLNKIITDSAQRDLSTILGDDTLTAYDISSTVTFNSPTLISMNFTGYNNDKDAAHPTMFLYTVTVDVPKVQVIQLKDLVKINQNFVGVLLNGTYKSMNFDMTGDIASSIRSDLNEYGIDFWISELNNADTFSHTTSSYLTKDALVVSVTVSHAMGDHIEIILPYKDLKGYQTVNQAWQVLT